MAEEIAGKIFSTPEEAGVTRPTDAELAHARKLFDEFQEQIDRVPESERWTEVSFKFWDDTPVPSTRAGRTASQTPPPTTPTPRGPSVDA
jgi:hypothetical protein